MKDAKCTTGDKKKCTVNLNEYGINLPDGKWAVDPDKNQVGVARGCGAQEYRAFEWCACHPIVGSWLSELVVVWLTGAWLALILCLPLWWPACWHVLDERRLYHVASACRDLCYERVNEHLPGQLGRVSAARVELSRNAEVGPLSELAPHLPVPH